MNTNFELIDGSAPISSRHDAGDIVDLLDPLLYATRPVKATVPAANPPAARNLHRPARHAQCVETVPDTATDPLAPSRGIAVGLVLSVPLWAFIGLGVWFIF